MKLGKTMIYKINNILLIFILISTLSCKSQVDYDYIDCKESFDVNNQLFKKDCFHNGKIESMLYYDLKGNQIEVCANPDRQAEIFNNNDSLYNDFISRNIEYPNCEGEGRFYIALLIDEEGIALEKRIVKDIPGGCIGFAESTMKLIDKLPKWKPAEKKGQKVKCLKIISVKF